MRVVNWLRPLAVRLTRHTTRRTTNPPAFRLRVEELEDRLVPATVTWINPAGGDWNTAVNWSTGAVPGPSDDVIIDLPGQNTFTVTHTVPTVESVKSLNSQAAITFSAGGISLESSSSFAA